MLVFLRKGRAGFVGSRCFIEPSVVLWHVSIFKRGGELGDPSENESALNRVNSLLETVDYQ